VKRFVICFDGTWQSLRQKRLTNIGVIARSIAHKTEKDGKTVEQIVIYSRGVGSNINALDKDSMSGRVAAGFNKFIGGAFGGGVEDQIVDAYVQLCFNYELGDEIYIFGFSRGAFAARSFSGLINCSGILSRLHVEQAWDAFRLYQKKLPPNASDADKEAYRQERATFRYLFGKGGRDEQGRRVKLVDPPPIHYIGIFDTVVQRGFWSVVMGVPNLAERFKFHNLNVSPNVLSARHAIAVDEDRRGFPLRLWENLEADNQRVGNPNAFQQRWFVGTHGDVGGGEGSPLSAAPLKWIARGAADQGLRFYGTHGQDESDLHRILREAGIDEEDAFAIKDYDCKITRPDFLKALSPHNWHAGPRKIWSQKTKPQLSDIDATFDISVTLRAAAARVNPRYAPESLKPFRALLREAAARHLPTEDMRAIRRFLFWTMD
jgi:uncharacterized protein (DUF2235 family)